MEYRLPKIYFPHFEGKNPTEWLRKARKYFHLYQVHEELEVGVVEMYSREMLTSCLTDSSQAILGLTRTYSVKNSVGGL